MTTIAGSFLRSYRIPTYAGFAAILCVLTLIVPADPQPIMLTGGLVAEPWPLIIGLIAVGLPVVMVSPGPGLERSLPIDAARLRAAAVGVCFVAFVGFALVTTRLIDRPFDIALRNFALCAGLALASGIWWGASWAWAAPSAFALANWLYGVDDGNEAKNWALLMQGEQWALLATSLVALLVVATLWCWRGSRVGDET